MDVKELFNKCLDYADHCLKCVDGTKLGNSTPCSEWNLKALLNHMVYEVLWVPDLLVGQTVSEIGDKYEGDVLGANFQAAWDKASGAARKVVDELKDLRQIVHLSYADVPASSYIKEIAGDILIHSWDVDQSIKCSLILDEDVMKMIYSTVLPRQDEFAASGLFGSPVSVSDDAALQTRLLAIFGRRDIR